MLKIIISPAQKMNIIDEYPCRLAVPAFQEKARLSGFYGILRPTDGVIPYRLEMRAKMARGEMVR